jgi:hypothetical protein
MDQGYGVAKRVYHYGSLLLRGPAASYPLASVGQED